MKAKFNKEAKEKLKEGIDILANSVKVTLGPLGRNVIFTDEFGNIRSTKDGVTIAKEVKDLDDPISNMGAFVVRQTAIKTAEQAGDGTTTSTVLAQELISLGLEYIKQDNNAVQIKKGMDKALEQVKKDLKTFSIKIKDKDQLKQIATLSANNDEEIGNLVATAMDKVGTDGIVTAEQSKFGDTNLETVEGMQFDRGYKSHLFATDNNTMQCILNDAYILIYDKRITQAKDILGLLEKIASENKSLLIIAEDVDGEALSTLIVNKMRGTIKACAVKAPEFGEMRQHVLEDIANITGGTVVSFDKGMRLDKFDISWLGEARTVTINKDTTTIVDGKGDSEKISNRVNEIKNQLDNAATPFEKERLQDRLAKIVGGVAVINVGGANDIEIKERKDRVDDALQAAKSSLQEGILPGGGVALLRCIKGLNLLSKKIKDKDEKIGFKIVIEAIKKPFIQILLNAGYDKDTIDSYILKINKNPNLWYGYNSKTGKFVNTLSNGIIDPTKVTRCALENAIAVSGTILITEATLYKEKKEEKEEPNMMGM
jgi:chaperonin GroEL